MLAYHGATAISIPQFDIRDTSVLGKNILTSMSEKVCTLGQLDAKLLREGDKPCLTPKTRFRDKS